MRKSTKAALLAAALGAPGACGEGAAGVGEAPAGLIQPGTDDRLDPACVAGSPGGEAAMAEDGVGQYVPLGGGATCAGCCSAFITRGNFVATYDACVPPTTSRGEAVGTFVIGKRATSCGAATATDPKTFPLSIVDRRPNRLAVMVAKPATVLGQPVALEALHDPAKLWLGADHPEAKESTMISVQDRLHGAGLLTVSPFCWHNGRGFGNDNRKASHNCDSAPNPAGHEKAEGGLIYANLGVPGSPVPGTYAYAYHVGPFGSGSPQNVMFFLSDDAAFLAPYLPPAAAPGAAP